MAGHRRGVYRLRDYTIMQQFTLNKIVNFFLSRAHKCHEGKRTWTQLRTLKCKLRESGQNTEPCYSRKTHLGERGYLLVWGAIFDITSHRCELSSVPIAPDTCRLLSTKLAEIQSICDFGSLRSPKKNIAPSPKHSTP